MIGSGHGNSERKNKVSAQRKGLAQCKEKFPQAERGDAKWRSARVVLAYLGRGIIGIWGGARCIWGGQVGEWSAIMGSARLSPCSVVLPAKSEKWQL